MALDEVHLLGKAVRGVRLLVIAVPELILVQRDRGELRVGTDGPDDDSLPDPFLPGGIDHLDPHHRIVI